MRNLFLLLLLANLVFAMWWLWVEPTNRPEAQTSTTPANAPRLLLISEVDAMLSGETEATEVAGLALAAPEPIVADDAAVDVQADAVDEGGTGGDGTSGVAATPDVPDSAAVVDPAAAPPEPDAAVGVGAAGSDGAPGAGEPDDGEDLIAVAADTGDESAAVVAVAATQVDAAPAPGRCVSVGPFLDLAEATVAASTLRAGGLEPRQRLAESQVLAGYWVHLPAYPSRAAAIAAVEGLRESGVTDIYIEPSGDQRNAVSLGIFSDRARAESHAGTIRALDFGAVVSERFRPAQAYWIDVDLAASGSVDTSGLGSSASAAVRVEEDACGE